MCVAFLVVVCVIGMSDKCSPPVFLAKRRWVDDTRSIRSNQIRYMNDEVREKQLESQKFSRQYDEVSRKLAEEQEVGAGVHLWLL